MLLIAQTTNGGASWQITTDTHPPFHAPYLRAIEPLGHRWVVLSASGGLWQSTGVGWRRIPLPPHQAVQTFLVRNSMIYAIFSAHRLAATADAGQTWHTLLATRGSQTIASIEFLGHDGWVLEQAAHREQITNTLLFTPNQGKTFSRIYTATVPNARALITIEMATLADGWAFAGACNDIPGACATLLYRTSNGGHTWQRVSLPSLRYHYPNPQVPSTPLIGFRPSGFIGPAQGFITLGFLPPGATNPVVFYTQDGGMHWTQKTLAPGKGFPPGAGR